MAPFGKAARVAALAFVASAFVGAACSPSFATVRSLNRAQSALLMSKTFGSGIPSSPDSDEVLPIFPASASVSAVQEWLTGAIQLRIAKLNGLSADVTQASELRTTQRSALSAIVSNTLNGMTALLESVPNETTIAALQASADEMITDYHVMSVVSPQVTTLVAIDSTLGSAEGLATLKPGINAAIYADKQAHKQVASAISEYESFSSSINAVTSNLASEQTALLVLSPANVPGSLATIAAARQTETTEAGVVANAKREVNLIAELLVNSPPGLS